MRLLTIFSAEETGRGSLLNCLSCLPSDPISQGTELSWTAITPTPSPHPIPSNILVWPWSGWQWAKHLALWIKTKKVRTIVCVIGCTSYRSYGGRQELSCLRSVEISQTLGIIAVIGYFRIGRVTVPTSIQRKKVQFPISIKIIYNYAHYVNEVCKSKDYDDKDIVNKTLRKHYLQK